MDLQDQNKQKPEKNKKLYVLALKKSYWLLVGLVPILIIFLLLVHKPFGYSPAGKADDDNQQKQLSTDITNRLLPQFYNSIQGSEPFDITIAEQQVNDIIAYCNWPRCYRGFIFHTPKATLSRDLIKLMCTVVKSGIDIELAVTVRAKPKLDEEGLLNFNVNEVEVGAINITLLAAIIAKKIYQQQHYIDPNDLRSRIVVSLFENKPFKPVFEVKNRKVRIEQINLGPGKLTLRFLPIPD